MEKNLKIGTDLDGVLATNDLNRADYRPLKMREYYSKCKPTKLSKIPVDVIITGRKKCYSKVTIGWLYLNSYLPKKLVMFPVGMKKNNETLCKYKCHCINKLGLHKYYEDDKRIADYLRANCPDTEIILVTDEFLQSLESDTK